MEHSDCTDPSATFNTLQFEKMVSTLCPRMLLRSAQPERCRSNNQAQCALPLSALGHSTTSADLIRYTRDFAALPVESGMAERLGVALGRCGNACAPAIETLVTTGEPAHRTAAYSALAHMRLDENAIVRARIASLASRARMDRGEQIEYERAMAASQR